MAEKEKTEDPAVVNPRYKGATIEEVVLALAHQKPRSVWRTKSADTPPPKDED